MALDNTKINQHTTDKPEKNTQLYRLRFKDQNVESFVFWMVELVLSKALVHVLVVC